jgi:UrcA family protein
MTLNANTKFACAVLAVACTFGTIAVPAKAEPVAFAYHRAELADTDALHARIRQAARRACETHSSLLPRSIERECREDIEAQLVAQIGGAADPGTATLASVFR